MNSPTLIIKRFTSWSLAYFLAFATLLTCGQDKKDDPQSEPKATSSPGQNPDSEPKSSGSSESKGSSDAQPSPSIPANPPFASIWIASSASRMIAGYDSNGNRLSFVDLSNYATSGGITSLTFVNRDILLATLDPGAANERIVRIDLKGNDVSSINPGWFTDSTNFNNINMYKILKQSSSKLLAVKSTAQVESLGMNLTSNIVTRLGNPWIGTIGSCLCTTNQYAIFAPSGVNTKLLAFSSGANTRINVYGNLTSSPSCDSSYNYTASYPTGAAYVPTGAARLNDGKIYVRFQHATTPLIARYDFDGTTISNGAAAFSDAGFLSQDVVSRDLVTADGSTLLFSNWNNDSILRWTPSTSNVEFLIHDAFSIDINAIEIRPTN